MKVRNSLGGKVWCRVSWSLRLLILYVHGCTCMYRMYMGSRKRRDTLFRFSSSLPLSKGFT